MKTILIFVAAAALLFASNAALACDYPARAKIVNGATATKDEMITSQKSVKTYIAAMDSYLDCIEEEEKDAVESQGITDETVLRDRQALLTKKYDAAVEEMEIVAAEFNEQVRAYKARSD